MLGDFPETLKTTILNGNAAEADIVLSEILEVAKSMVGIKFYHKNNVLEYFSAGSCPNIVTDSFN